MMKKVLSIVCLTLLVGNVLADEKILDSSISAVVAYPDSGAVTRQAEITLPAGEHTLYFQHLPSQLDTNSVQVDAQANVPNTILEITTKEQRKLEVANDRLQEVDKQIELLKNENLVLQDQARILVDQQNTVKLMQQGMLVPNKNGAKPTLDELKNIMLFSKDELTANLEKLSKIAEQRQLIMEKLRQLNSELVSLFKQASVVKNVGVRVYLEKAGTIKLNLTYVLPNITWKPRYDIRFDSTQNKLVLTYLGNVQQTTGEDWRNIKLTFSTARPSSDTAIPTLNPWFLNERAAAKSNNIMASADVNMSNYTAVAPVATVSQELTSASFNISKPISLLSGSTSKFIDITTMNLPVSLSYIAVPRLSQAVYLQVNTVNQSDYPLLSGQTNIFMNNRFVTSSYLKTTMPNEKFALDLGIDPAIAVTYKLVKQFTEQTGLTNGYTKITYDYLLTIQNNKMSAEKIKILNQIPISSDDQITVKLLSPSAQAVSLDKEGKTAEEWTLKAGEKKEQQLKYFVEYPKTLRVMGL